MDNEPVKMASMDPMQPAMPLMRDGIAPYQAPHHGSTHRPDFRSIKSSLTEIKPDTAQLLDTHAQLARDQARREAAADADRARIASLPTREEQVMQRLAAVEADCNALRIDNDAYHKAMASIERRLAQLESTSRVSSKGRRGADLPPEAA